MRDKNTFLKIYKFINPEFSPGMGAGSVLLLIFISVDLEVLVQDPPIRVKLGALVTLEPALADDVAVLGVRVVVKLFEIFVLEKNESWHLLGGSAKLEHRRKISTQGIADYAYII
jgi:hypothetical protein